MNETYTYIKETHKRSLAKGISWRVAGSFSTMAIVYILTGDTKLVLGIGAFEIVAKTVFYYLHERAWAKVAWGRIKTLDQS